MFKRVLIRSALMGLFVLSLLVIPACSQSAAEPCALTGSSVAASDMHERHSVGLESQVADY